MFSFGTQEVDSVRRPRVCFEPIKVDCGARKSKIEIFKEPSPVSLKRKEKAPSRPTKRVKISSKPNYEFLDTQEQCLTPFSTGKSQVGGNGGALVSVYNEFLGKRTENTVICRVVCVKAAYGCKIATVKVEKSTVEGIIGTMQIVCNAGITMNSTICLVEPKIITTDKGIVIAAKSIITSL
jgi:hypothetical protein